MALDYAGLTELRDGIASLIAETSDIEQKKELRKELTRVRDLIDKQIYENLDRDTEKYKAATAALNKANQSIKEAQQDIAKVAKTITQIAKGIDLAVEAASKVT